MNEFDFNNNNQKKRTHSIDRSIFIVVCCCSCPFAIINIKDQLWERERENETNRNKQQTTNRLSKTLICIIISQHLKTTITFYLSCSFSLLSFSFGFNYIIISMIRGIKKIFKIVWISRRNVMWVWYISSMNRKTSSNQ